MDEHTSKQDHSGTIEWDGRGWDGRSAASAPAFAEKSAEAHGEMHHTQIFLLTERDARYWTSELGVTIYTLREAIAEVGTRCARTVRARINGEFVTATAQT